MDDNLVLGLYLLLVLLSGGLVVLFARHRRPRDGTAGGSRLLLGNLLVLLAFYIYLAWKQAHANGQLIAQLEGDAAAAKTQYRKTWPFQPGWQKEIHVWPFLLRVEFLAAVIVTIILMIWSITLNAPLEEPANPNLTMNPAKAPWYFLGLQEMLVY